MRCPCACNWEIADSIDANCIWSRFFLLAIALLSRLTCRSMSVSCAFAELSAAAMMPPGSVALLR